MTSRSRWIREQNPVSMSVRKWLCSRCRVLVFLLILFCVAVQTFFTSQASTHLKVPDKKDTLFPPVQNFWKAPDSKPSLELKQDRRSLQAATAADHHQNKGYGKSSDGLPRKVDEKGHLAAGFQVERRHTSGCHPRSHICFLKTHKTGSSTILNILYRYGESGNLTFAFPKNRNNQLFYPNRFSSRFVRQYKNVTKFHIICNHMRFRKSEVEKVMPKDTFYFSILRHPVAMMESIFVYYKSIGVFRTSKNLEQFLNTTWRNYTSPVAKNSYAHNNLAFDFGFENNVTDETKDLEETTSKVIAAIEQDFHLILISDYFDESMILLKHALCWSLEDVASFRLNSRSEKARQPVSTDTAEKIKRWNVLDWRIYRHFNATFWHKVDSLVGKENMKREISELRALQAKLASTCLKGGQAVNPSQIKEARLKPFQYGAAVIQGYNIKPDLDPQTKTKCVNLITPELQYTYRLYDQQLLKTGGKI